MKYLLAHDIGTSGNKATLFSTEGKMVASEVYSYETNWFNSVWAEQNPEDWYEAVQSTTARLLKNIDPADVLGVSFSGQMMGCLCVDREGQALLPSIIWADMRATEEEAFIRSRIPAEEFYRITGHRPSASYSLAKLLWIQKHHPAEYKNCFKVLNAKDYVLFRLTGEFVTDYSDASGTNLLDINSLQWSQRIADAVDVELDKMPELCKSTDVIGSLTPQAAKETGLDPCTKIICGGGDGSMSAVGAKCIAPGDLFCTLGTSAWNASSTDHPVFDSSMRTFNWVHIVPGLYVPCGTMQAAGASVSWLKDQLAGLELKESENAGTSVYKRMDEMADSAAPGSGGLFYLPYLLGERSPRWNPDARGAFIGLKMETARADIFRSVYEGVAYNLEIILRLILQGDSPESLVMTGGGARSRVWCQIFADIYNMTIRIPDNLEEATSIGAALTAGVGLGVYESFEVIDDFIRIEDEIKPGVNNAEFYRDRKSIFEKLYQALSPVYTDMAAAQK
ncbi:MAG: xylulokinase [Spirochaetales bacterium]|nr:xylulokinase [Spirochaetales bacterium]